MTLETRRRGLLAATSSLMLLLFHILLFRTANAAHSRRRLVVRTSSESSEPKYDRSITTFDPTGRLLQVEYGMAATLRGLGVTAVLRHDGSILVLVANSQSSASSASSKVHRLDDHLWMFSAGLSGDARFLASHLRETCRQHRLAYGEAPTVEEAARAAASAQHSLTRIAGARPLGCTAIVLGMDEQQGGGDDERRTAAPSSSTMSEIKAAAAAARSRIFRTDPGGILEDCVYCCAGQYQERIMAELRDCYDDTICGQETVNAVQQLLTTVQKDHVAGGSGDEDKQMTYDLWIFRPSDKTRGGSRVTCFLNVGSSQSLDRIRAHLRDEVES